MTPPKRLLHLIALLLLCVGHGSAHAGLKFGDDERVRFVAPVSLQGPKDEPLYLARKITTHHFLLPYAMDDGGYVLGIVGESRAYYPLPEARLLETLQSAGKLPQPLPSYEIGALDWFFGHLLWPVLAGLLGYGAFSYLRRKPQPEPSLRGPTQFADTQPTPELPPTEFTGQPIALPMTLYTSRGKQVALLLGALVFVIGGVFLIDKKPGLAYACIGFFGLCALVGLAQLASPKRAQLQLNAEGFSVTNVWRTTHHRWREVAVFGVFSVQRQKSVGWLFDHRHAQPAKGRGMSVALTGFEASLPDNYGMKVDRLAALMNELKRRSAARPLG